MRTVAQLALVALAACRGTLSDKAVMLAVPADVESAGLSEAQLRDRLTTSPWELFLALEAADGLALIPHYRVRHSTTRSYLPQAASMTSPLAVSTLLVVDRSALSRSNLCLVLRAGPRAPWRKLTLTAPARQQAAATGRLPLPPVDSIPELF